MQILWKQVLQPVRLREHKVGRSRNGGRASRLRAQRGEQGNTIVVESLLPQLRDLRHLISKTGFADKERKTRNCGPQAASLVFTGSFGFQKNRLSWLSGGWNLDSKDPWQSPTGHLHTVMFEQSVLMESRGSFTSQKTPNSFNTKRLTCFFAVHTNGTMFATYYHQNSPESGYHPLFLSPDAAVHNCSLRSRLVLHQHLLPC